MKESDLLQESSDDISAEDIYETNKDLKRKGLLSCGEYLTTETNKSDVLSVQPGGNHYKDMKIQPIEFIQANSIPYIEGNVIKYICRWRKKNGLEDLKKVKHYVDLLIKLERLDEEK